MFMKSAISIKPLAVNKNILVYLLLQHSMLAIVYKSLHFIGKKVRIEKNDVAEIIYFEKPSIWRVPSMKIFY